MDNNLLYHPSDLDIAAVQREQADSLIEAIELPEMQETEPDEDESEDLLDMRLEQLKDEDNS